MLTGNGGTGKSILIDLVQKQVGIENCSNIPIQDLNQSFYATGMFGKLLNACGDIPCKAMSSTDVVKKAVGEDALVFEKAAWDEMRDVRRGRDETIDHSMTDQNVWLCGSTDMDMEAEIQKYIDQVNADKKAHGKRALRCDAVTGIEMIEKPPIRECCHGC